MNIATPESHRQGPASRTQAGVPVWPSGLFPCILAAMCLAVGADARCATSQPFDPADYMKPICPSHFNMSDDAKSCNADGVAAIAKREDCAAPWLAWDEKATPRC